MVSLKEWSGAATIDIGCPRADVWNFIGPAETASLTNPEVVRAFKVPGTPDGVGEQQAVVVKDPSGSLVAHIIEIAALVPLFKAETRNVTGLPGRATWECVDIHNGTRVTYTIHQHLPRWKLYQMTPSAALTSTAQIYLSRVKSILEGGPADSGSKGVPGPAATPHDDLRMGRYDSWS